MKAGPIIAGAVVALALVAGSKAATTETPPPVGSPPAGTYTLDKSHGSLIFRVDHLGFSRFTGRMEKFDVKLWFDPDHPEKSRVEATVDPASLATDNPPAKFLAMLRGPDWLAAQKYKAITFRSKSVKVSGRSADITGDFTLHGVTRPLTLHARFNGGYAGHPYDPQARIGISARGTFKRSQFGIALGLPPPGTTMGVGDDVEVQIEAEFSGPPLKKQS